MQKRCCYLSLEGGQKATAIAHPLPPYDQFVKFVHETFPAARAPLVRVYYRDEEGDTITISTSEDLQSVAEGTLIYVQGTASQAQPAPKNDAPSALQQPNNTAKNDSSNNYDNYDVVSVHSCDEEEGGATRESPSKKGDKQHLQDALQSVSLSEDEYEEISLPEDTAPHAQGASTGSPQKPQKNLADLAKKFDVEFSVVMTEKLMPREGEQAPAEGRTGASAVDAQGVDEVDFNALKLKSILGGEATDYRRLCEKMKGKDFNVILDNVMSEKEKADILNKKYEEGVRRTAAEIAQVLQGEPVRYYELCRVMAHRPVNQIIEMLLNDDKLVERFQTTM